jgi:FkbM family methyltransferase
MNSEWIVRTYEANPFVAEMCRQQVLPEFIQQHPLKSITFHEKAVSSSNSVTKMSCIKGLTGDNGKIVSDSDFGGSSIVNRTDERFAEQLIYELVNVDTVDIITILEEVEFAYSGSTVYIKMDIEGAEFDVLTRLLERPDLARNVKVAYIEWHERFFANSLGGTQEKSRQRKALVNSLEEYGVECMTHW